MDWTSTPPKEEGLYYLYGYDFVGGMGMDYFPETTFLSPELFIINVRQIGGKASGDLAFVASGAFMSKSQFSKDIRREGHLGYWKKIELPTPPQDVEHLFK